MSEPPTVYITNRSASHDYTSATKHGAIRFVTSGNYPVFKTSRLQEEVAEALAYSQPSDYLLLSGSSVVASICVAVWLEMHSTCHILIWDRVQDVYVLRIISKSEIAQLVAEVANRLQFTRSS